MTLDLELGTFIFLNLIAIGTMILGMIPKDRLIIGAMMLVAMIMFFVIALFMVGEYDVVVVKTFTDGATTWTERQLIISDANTQGISWAYVGIATTCLILFIMRWRQG